MKNPMGKTRATHRPYAIFKAGSTEYRVVKTNQLPKNETKNPYAIWKVDARSPMTYGKWEGARDAYKRDILNNFTLVKASPEFAEAYPELQVYDELLTIYHE